MVEAMAAKRYTPNRFYVGVIADMVGSRKIAFERRPEVQERLQLFVLSLNKRFRKYAATGFAVTLGDEFQALLWNGDALPDLIWALEEEFTEIPLRLGVGYGPVTTRLPAKTIHSDGPALHTARAAIEMAKQNDWMGGVFVGFGSRQDEVLNGLARLLSLQRRRFTVKQRERIAALREAPTQVAAAKRLGLKPQTLNESVGGVVWDVYRQGESALSAMLSLSCEETP